MPKKGRQVRSMRGTVVDFDLMEIKQQMAAAPKTADVEAREDFVDRRLRRRQRAAERAKALAESKPVAIEVEPETLATEEPADTMKHVAPVLEEPENVAEPVSPAPRKKRKITKKPTTKE